MNNLSPVLENLKQRTVQETPVKLIYADNDFSVFDKGASEFYGSEDEFIFSGRNKTNSTHKQGKITPVTFHYASL